MHFEGNREKWEIKACYEAGGCLVKSDSDETH